MVMLNELIFLDVQDNCNLGDDLLIISVFDRLVSHYSKQFTEIVVRSERLQSLLRDYSKFINCNEVPISIKTNSTQARYLHCGGTLFTNRYKLSTKIAFYSGLALPSVIFKNAKTSDYSIFSLGVDDKIILRRQVSELLKKFRLIWARDVRTVANLSRLGIDLSKVFFAYDIAFGFPLHKLQLNNSNSANFKLGRISRGIDKNMYSNSSEILKIGLNGETDADVSYEGCWNSAVEVIGKIFECSTIYTERYHGAILSILMNKPTIINMFDLKLRNLHDQFQGTLLSNELSLILGGDFSEKRNQIITEQNFIFAKYFER